MKGLPTLRLALILALAGCGGGDGGGALPTRPSGAAIMPLSFAAGDAVGVVVLDHQTKEPGSLTTESCRLTNQVGRASASVEIPRTDAEGPCIVTDADVELRGLEPDVAPVCVGALRVAFGASFNRAITLCDATEFPPATTLDCADLAGATSMTVTSNPDELPGDELGAYSATVTIPDVPALLAPLPQGDGTALWPADELRLEWGGEAAESVEIVLRRRDGGAAVRCYVPDTGTFTVPERLVAPYRTTIATIEVARVAQVAMPIDGFDMRASVRKSTAAWLFMPAAP